MQARAQAKQAIQAVLAKAEAALALSPQSLLPGGALTLADVALSAPLHALLGAALGAKARAALPATVAWLQALLAAQPHIATALGEALWDGTAGVESSPSREEAGAKRAALGSRQGGVRRGVGRVKRGDSMAGRATRACHAGC